MPNIHNLARWKASSTTAQDIVKAVEQRPGTFKRQYKHRHRQLHQLAAACWPRWCTTLPGYFQATQERTQEQVSFTVPSGNFGNVCAGHVARMMGLPIAKRLVVATNENDVLDEFFRTGTYRVRGSRRDASRPPARPWTSPRPRNFERFVFDLLGRDGARCGRAVWPDACVEGKASSRLTEAEMATGQQIAGYGFQSGRSSSLQIGSPPSAAPIERFGDMVDTHTADGR